MIEKLHERRHVVAGAVRLVDPTARLAIRRNAYAVRRICRRILGGRPFELDGAVYIGSPGDPDYIALAQLRANGMHLTDCGQVRLFRLKEWIEAGLIHLFDDEDGQELMAA